MAIRVVRGLLRRGFEWVYLGVDVFFRVRVASVAYFDSFVLLFRFYYFVNFSVFLREEDGVFRLVKEGRCGMRV